MNNNNLKKHQTIFNLALVGRYVINTLHSIDFFFLSMFFWNFFTEKKMQ